MPKVEFSSMKKYKMSASKAMKYVIGALANGGSSYVREFHRALSAKPFTAVARGGIIFKKWQEKI